MGGDGGVFLGLCMYLTFSLGIEDGQTVLVKFIFR